METYLSMEIKAKENQMEVQYKCLIVRLSFAATIRKW